jgi:hypothetical protein
VALSKWPTPEKLKGGISLEGPWPHVSHFEEQRVFVVVVAIDGRFMAMIN